MSLKTIPNALRFREGFSDGDCSSRLSDPTEQINPATHDVEPAIPAQESSESVLD